MSEIRCEWAEGSDSLRAYHDTEWGNPVRDDVKLFEFLVLDCFQAGLSWATILNKREGFERAFRRFDPEAVARMDEEDVDRLLTMPEIVRNRAKIEATILNARALLQVTKTSGGFSDYLWGFVGGRTIQNAWRGWGDIPAQTEESRWMSADLKRRGFRFVGPTICYAVMQSAGMVNDHVLTCFRYSQLGGAGGAGGALNDAHTADVPGRV